MHHSSSMCLDTPLLQASICCYKEECKYCLGNDYITKVFKAPYKISKGQSYLILTLSATKVSNNKCFLQTVKMSIVLIGIIFHTEMQLEKKGIVRVEKIMRGEQKEEGVEKIQNVHLTLPMLYALAFLKILQY